MTSLRTLCAWTGLAALVGPLACTPVPPSCIDMCAAAVPLQEACLERDGLTWDDTPAWDDAEGFRESCEAWAWAARRLEADAKRRGTFGEGPGTAETCTARADVFQEGTCEDLEAAGWDLPWE